jgi:tetratricopeptide (TPR) repeat protein/SAM-dependent methyltransferase
MPKLQLPSVTLTIYEVRAHRLGAMAVRSCLEQADFAAVHVWTDRPELFEIDGPIHFHTVDGASSKKDGQADLWHEFGPAVTTPHLLNIEWDSWIVDPEMWDDEFLKYDYLGAPWPFHPELTVGNGGFALISSALMRRISEARSKYPYRFPWDDALCRVHRPLLEEDGFSWAPEPLAAKFSYEYGPLRRSFGFHDCRNFPALLSLRDLSRRIEAADDYVKTHSSWVDMISGEKRRRAMDVTPEGYEHQPVHSAIEELNDIAAKMGEHGLFQSAVTVTQRAIRINPRAAVLWSNLASHYWHLQRYEEGRDCAMRALSLDGKYALAWKNLALCLESLGNIQDAERAMNTVLVHDPTNAGAVWDRSLIFLKSGFYKEGWRDYEARVPYRGSKVYGNYAAPIWQGEDLTGKTIFVRAEQGIGDMILFSRFLPWLAERAEKVYVLWPFLVSTLLWQFRRYVEIVPESVPIPETDYLVHMGSLPHRYGATLDDLPPDPGLILERVEQTNRTMPVEVPMPAGLPFKPFRIGICWTGNPSMEKNLQRSIPLELLFGLAAHPKVWLYSLQCGPASNDIRRLGLTDFIVDDTAELAKRGLAATGSAMLQLDLVITCCTSIAHLAGALGLKAWVIVPEDPYWVWGRNATDSTPWWPSLRVFRQTEPGDWETVVNEVKNALEYHLADPVFEVVTQHPVAINSLDHLEPRGTKNDDTHCEAFVRRCAELYTDHPVRFLDLGCSGGGLVADFLEAGHLAFGLEGSDYSFKRRRATWGRHPAAVATCDVSRSFHIHERGREAKFDVISAWEVLEHLDRADLPQFWANVRLHLASNGTFVGSVSSVHDFTDDGRDYHSTVQPLEWWRNSLVTAGFKVVDSPFSKGEYPRGPFSEHEDPGFYVVAKLAAS